MIATHDTNPDTFNFVLNRIYGLFLGKESNIEKEPI